MKSLEFRIKEVCMQKSISLAKVAKAIGDSPQNFGQKLKRGDLPVSELIEVCTALNHNFLFDIAKDTGIKFATPDKYDISIDELIEHKVNKLIYDKTPRHYRTSSHLAMLNEPDAKYRTNDRK